MRKLFLFQLKLQFYFGKFWNFLWCHYYRDIFYREKRTEKQFFKIFILVFIAINM